MLAGRQSEPLIPGTVHVWRTRSAISCSARVYSTAFAGSLIETASVLYATPTEFVAEIPRLPAARSNRAGTVDREASVCHAPLRTALIGPRDVQPLPAVTAPQDSRSLRIFPRLGRSLVPSSGSARRWLPPRQQSPPQRGMVLAVGLQPAADEAGEPCRVANLVRRLDGKLQSGAREHHHRHDRQPRMAEGGLDRLRLPPCHAERVGKLLLAVVLSPEPRRIPAAAAYRARKRHHGDDDDRVVGQNQMIDFDQRAVMMREPERLALVQAGIPQDLRDAAMPL